MHESLERTIWHSELLGFRGQPERAGPGLDDRRRLPSLPGLAILGLVLAVNLLGEGLRDALDPRLRLGATAPRPEQAGAPGGIPTTAATSG